MAWIAETTIHCQYKDMMGLVLKPARRTQPQVEICAVQAAKSCAHALEDTMTYGLQQTKHARALRNCSTDSRTSRAGSSTFIFVRMPGDSPHWTTVGRGPLTDIVDAQHCPV